MRKTLTIGIIAFLVLSFTCLISCKSCQDRTTTMQPGKKVEEEQAKTLKREMGKNVYPLPTSAQVIKMLTEFEVAYQIGLTNPAENSRKYYTRPSRAINMGVFGADLSYATIYNVKQQVINYLEAIRIIGNELNLSKIYNVSLYDSIIKNFDNRDRLVDILSNAFDSTYAYLVENDQQNLALLVVGGAWVEGMYLTTCVSEAAYQAAGFSKNLLEQKKSFELYLDITKPYLDDPMISDFIKKLEPIKTVYEGLGTSLNMKNIADITKAMNIVREQIIK